MIPIRDSVRSHRFPAVNTALIVLNMAAFLAEVARGEGLEAFLLTWSLVPARLTDPSLSAYFSWFHQAATFVTYMFLHGGFWHLLGNMWFLYIFGDNVEDRLGHPRYLLFYLLCGVASGVIHFLSAPGSPMPTVGASGAIAGVMGAYLILYPRARVLTLIPIIIFPWFVEIPAFVFLGIWILIQFLNAALTAGQVSGVAWWAHVGGFVVGIVFLKMLLLFPETGVSRKLGEATVRERSPRLQKTGAWREKGGGSPGNPGDHVPGGPGGGEKGRDGPERTQGQSDPGGRAAGCAGRGGPETAGRGDAGGSGRARRSAPDGACFLKRIRRRHVSALRLLVEFRVQLLRAIRAQAVAERHVGVLGQVGLQLVPAALVVADFFAAGTDRNKAGERLDLIPGRLQFVIDPLGVENDEPDVHNHVHLESD